MFEVVVRNVKTDKIEQSFLTGNDFTIVFNHPDDTKNRAYCTQIHANEESAIMMLAALTKAISVNMGYPLEALTKLLQSIGELDSADLSPEDMTKPLDKILKGLKSKVKTKVMVLGLGDLDNEEKELAESITMFVERALDEGMSMDAISKVLEKVPKNKGGLN